jgi:hypothetical protein
MAKILFIFSFVLNFYASSQTDSITGDSVETILIKKANYSLYRGVLAETKSWYLLTDDQNKYYLANLDRPAEGVYDWFVRFKDSQNIYKSINSNEGGFSGGLNQYPTLHFKKENEPGDFLNFYLDKTIKNTVFLTSISDGMVYKFELQNQ